MEDEGKVPTFTSNTTNSIRTMSITKQDMERALNSLKINKSPGTDGHQPRILKELSSELSRPLALLFNKTMHSG